MKFHIFPHHTATGPARAILLFAGWGMDEKPFAGLGAEGYETIILWDYEDPAVPEALDKRLAAFDEIAVIAWSFGVPAATRFIAGHPELPVTARIAVNGTMHPVDDHTGIPEAIFNGTLDRLDERSLSKFYLRMCGSGESFRDFASHMPGRSIDGLKAELRRIRDDSSPVIKDLWDCAIVSDGDRIIPPDNQLHAWRDNAEAFRTLTVNGPHRPDFGAIIAAFITEKGRVAEKFSRAGATYDANAAIQHDIASRLCSMLPASPGDTLEIGGGTGSTTRMLLDSVAPRSLAVWDLHIPASLRETAGLPPISYTECDAETEIARLRPGSLGLIFSASTVQWFNSLPVFLRHTAKALCPGGEAVISTFGPLTMREISPAHNVRYPDMADIRRMIPGDCTILHLSEETVRMTFPSPVEALRHIKLTGVNAIGGRSSAATTRGILRDYPLLPSGEAPLTYQPVYIHIRKNH